MGLFAPGWKKSPEKARDRIQKSSDPAELYRIATETSFPGADGTKVRLWATDKITALRGTPAGKSFLEKLSREGSTALIRCYAAHNLKTEEGKRIVEKDLAAAYNDRGFVFFRNVEDWINDIQGTEKIKAVYDSIEDMDLKRSVAFKIKDRELLPHLILTARDGETACLLMRDFNGTPQQYREISERTSFPECAESAAYGMDLSCEDRLISLAKGGSWSARDRLVDLDVKKYARKYPEVLDWNKLNEAIDAGIYSQQELEEFTMKDTTVGRSSPVYHAMLQITEEDRLERLLLERPVPKGSFANGSWTDWVMELMKKLGWRGDIMEKYILSDHDNHQFELESKALEHINDPDALLRIAMANTSVSLDAAKRISTDNLAELRGSKSKAVTKWADKEWAEKSIETAGEDELVEIIRLALEDPEGEPRFYRALELLPSQKSLIAAFKAFRETNQVFKKHYSGSREYNELFEKMLSRITDGEGLAELCLSYPHRYCGLEITRLRELIAGTETEKRFTRRVRAVFLKEAPVNEGSLTQLATYYGMQLKEAEWKIGGKEYIKRLLNILESHPEKSTASKAAAIISTMYKFVPESRTALGQYRGKKYRVHDDYTDTYCGSRSHSREETITLLDGEV